MVLKSFFKRFVALLLCVALAGSALVPKGRAVEPVAASLTVAGGSLGVGGLSGGALASALAPYIAPIIGLTLAGCGLNAYVTKKSQEQGKTRTRFIIDTVVIYCFQAKIAKEKFYQKIAEGISIAADGTIQLSHEASKVISQFGEWLFTQDGLVVPAISGELQDTATINNYNFQGLALNTWYPCYYLLGTSVFTKFKFSFVENNAPVFALQCTDKMMILSNSSVLCRVTYSNENETNSFTSGNYTSSVYQSNAYVYALSGVQSSFASSGKTWDATYEDLKGHDVVISPGVAVPGEDCFLGDADSWAENKDVLNPGIDDTKVATLNPDLINKLIDSLAAGQVATMDITQYLDALASAFDQAIADVKTGIASITDSLTGIQQQLAIPDTATAAATVTPTTGDSTAEPAITDPATVEPDTVADAFSYDLTGIFPFCIPFDIYAMLSVLNADPVAPSYHVHWVAPYNIVIDFTVDLSPWNDVASLLRSLELLAFCIGLAYVTRSMFIRS